MKNAIFLSIAFLIWGCQSKENGNAEGFGLFSDKQVSNQNQNFTEGKDYQKYERYRIMDNEGFSQPTEAISILLPSGWNLQGGMKWIPFGQPCEGTTIDVKASSPDGKYTLEILPGVLWDKSDDPQMAMLNGQLSREGCFKEVSIPSSAEDYLRGSFGQSLGNPSISNVKQNADVVKIMAENDQKTYNEMMASGASDIRVNHEAITADLRWNDGKSGMVLIGFTNGYLVAPNVYNGTYMTFHSGNASTRIIFTFPEEDKEIAEQIFTTAISSIRTNPEWKSITDNYWFTMRQKGRQISADRVAMLDQQTREIGNRAIANGNQRLAQLDNEIRTWETKDNPNDRQYKNFLNTIREVENFRDESGTVEVPAGYNQVWNSNNGSNTYIMSNNPNFDPSSTFQDQRWQEMKKVE